MNKGIKMTDMVKSFAKAESNIGNAAMMRKAAHAMVAGREPKQAVDIKAALERYLR